MSDETKWTDGAESVFREWELDLRYHRKLFYKAPLNGWDHARRLEKLVRVQHEALLARGNHHKVAAALRAFAELDKEMETL